MDKTLQEEEDTDTFLTDIAEQHINMEAEEEDENEDDENDETEKPKVSASSF